MRVYGLRTSWDRIAGAAGVCRASRRGLGAFTLIEMILSLALVGMITALVVINVAGWHENRKLEEGAIQFGVALRLARADSANLGKRFRLAADEDTHRLRALYESRPLAAPGEFVGYRQATWAQSLPNDLIWVQRMSLRGASAFRTLALDEIRDADEREAAESLAPITFYPDGSSDSARAVLITRVGNGPQEELEDPEGRLALIDLDGTNGLIRTRLMTLAELEELEAEEANPSPPPPPGYAEDCEECDR